MTEIENVLRSHRVEIALAGEHHHARPGWLAIRKCPFCSSQNFHLGYNLAGGYFNCWKCKGHGVISTLVRLGVPYEIAAKFFRGRDPIASREERERRGVLVEPPGRGPLKKIHKDYLRLRGFDPDKIQETWELEGITELGLKLAWRIYIPISYRGERISWTTRSISEHASRRYISARADQESVNHKHSIYGLDLCQHVIVAVEGPADAWNVGPGAGALFGIDFTPAQVFLLSQFPSRFICFDSSPDAQRRARALASQLESFPGSTAVVELDAEDPGSASRKEIRSLRKMAGLPVI